MKEQQHLLWVGLINLSIPYLHGHRSMLLEAHPLFLSQLDWFIAARILFTSFVHCFRRQIYTETNNRRVGKLSLLLLFFHSLLQIRFLLVQRVELVQFVCINTSILVSVVNFTVRFLDIHLKSISTHYFVVYVLILYESEMKFITIHYSFSSPCTICIEHWTIHDCMSLIIKWRVSIFISFFGTHCVCVNWKKVLSLFIKYSKKHWVIDFFLTFLHLLDWVIEQYFFSLLYIPFKNFSS